MSTARVVAGRLAAGLVSAWIIVTLAFVLLHAAPGDPSRMAEDPHLNAADRARLREAYGLDRPLGEQYLAFLGNVARGELGVSLRYARPVSRVLAGAIGPTLVLMLPALGLAFALGLALGTRAAVRPGGIADALVRRALPALDALPPFWLGLLAIWFFAGRLGWLPSSAMTSAGGGGTGDLLRHLLLPVLTIALPGAAPVARHHAEAMRRELAAPHVRAARAMGLAEPRVIFGRAARAALHPAIALLGLSLPALAGGAAVVEVVFGWPGLGRIQQEALLARDVPLALGGLLLVALLVVAGGILTELLSARVDPRWRAAERSA
ncbi:MAG: ABC transporter permease [Acidobacteria bacterium]|nr:ABC transporter permease [Acidobacteriota bacterium]